MSNVYKTLQEHLDKLPIGYPSTTSGVEIRILKQLFSPEEAQIALKIKSIPATSWWIYRRVKKKGFTKTKTKEHLNNMVEKGAIYGKKKGNRIYYRITKLIIGMYDLQVKRITKEFMEDLKQYLDEGYAEEILVGRKINQIRTIPIEKSIPYKNFVYTYDNIRRKIKKCKNQIGIVECVCRKGQDLLGNSCKQTDLRESCFVFNEPAKYWINHKLARPIDKKEAIEILEKAENDGLVIQPSNTKRLALLCTCCGCCCEGLKIFKRFPNPLEYYQTNYYAEINSDKCVGCKICIDRCQMNAIEVQDVAKINYNFCIGCGNCIPSCPESAIILKKKKKKIKPPKTTASLFLKMQTESQGKWATIKYVLKMILSFKLYYLLKRK